MESRRAVGKVLVLPDGSPDSVTVNVKSAGHVDDFEKSVRDAVAGWRFEPGENDRGEPVRSWVKVKIKFELYDCQDGAE